MPAYAITDKDTLETLYVGIHPNPESALEIYLGYPSQSEIDDASLRVCVEQVDLYPTAQRCRLA